MLVWVPLKLLGQHDVAIGMSKVHPEPHDTVLFVGQSTWRQLVQQPVTVTVWLQLVRLPHASVINHVWVTNTCGHEPLVTVLIGRIIRLVTVPSGLSI